MEIERIAAIIAILSAVFTLVRWAYRKYHEPIRKRVVSWLRSLKDEIENQDDSKVSK